MLSQCPTLILSAVLGACSLSLAGTGALADILPPPDFASAEENVLAISIIDPPQKNQEPAIVWDRNTHGERCLYRIGACRLFHDGYYYETPWWGLPLAIDGGIDAVDY